MSGMASPQAAPPGWRRDSLDALAAVNPESLGAGVPAGYSFRYLDLSSADKGLVNWESVTSEELRTAPSRARRVIRPGDVLFGTVRPSLQSHTYVGPSDPQPLVASTGFAVLRARNGESVPRFLFHLIFSREVSTRVRQLEVGSGYPAVNESDLAKVIVLAPPVPEQRRIAEILDTLDDAIRATEQVIVKLEQMWQGLLHDLLTRGIDQSGGLRDAKFAPSKFSATSIGRVPKGWDVIPLSRMADWRSGSTPSKARAASWTGPVPWVSPKDMKTFMLADTADHLSESAIGLGGRLAPRGSVAIVVRGMILAHTFPVCVLQREMAFNQDVKVGVVGSDVEGLFLAYWLLGNASAMLGLVTEATHGTKKIDLSALRRIHVGRPPREEQLRIVERLVGQDALLGSERRLLFKMKLIRVGLADDLLTGRVRIKASGGGRA